MGTVTRLPGVTLEALKRAAVVLDAEDAAGPGSEAGLSGAANDPVYWRGLGDAALQAWLEFWWRA